MRVRITRELAEAMARCEDEAVRRQGEEWLLEMDRQVERGRRSRENHRRMKERREYLIGLVLEALDRMGAKANRKRESRLDYAMWHRLDALPEVEFRFVFKERSGANFRARIMYLHPGMERQRELARLTDKQLKELSAEGLIQMIKAAEMERALSGGGNPA